jgi:hypothetical protein
MRCMCMWRFDAFLTYQIMSNNGDTVYEVLMANMALQQGSF